MSRERSIDVHLSTEVGQPEAATTKMEQLTKAEDLQESTVDIYWPDVCEKAEMLCEIMDDMAVVEKWEFLCKKKKRSFLVEKKILLATRRDEFCQKFAPPNCASKEDRLKFCTQQLAIWKKWIINDFWWDTDGLLSSLNDLPRELLEEILYHTGAIHQSRLRLYVNG